MKQLDLVFLWHMHQPDYRDHGGAADEGEVMLPWVYLHAMKDYVDMAAHLERHPRIRCVVNLVPVLLDQIDDYARQFASGNFRDPLLRMLATPDLGTISDDERRMLLGTCFRSNHVTMLAPFPHYKSPARPLPDADGCKARSACRYLSGDYFSDLVTWYHLAWTGETERRRNPLLARLMSQGEGYAHDDRCASARQPSAK
jgi:alpha-amylase/alpha-mannosidase (GH57 family)